MRPEGEMPHRTAPTLTFDTILVAVGANLPGPSGRGPLATCVRAVEQLGRLPGMRMVAASPWYRSAPVPPSGQPDYINGVVRLSGEADPHALLAALHAIEAAAGRTRGHPNAARTLDLDLLAMDGMVAGGALVLPHPRLHQRAFVLLPLLDVAPDWAHPVLGPAHAMLAGVDRGGVNLASPHASD